MTLTEELYESLEFAHEAWLEALGTHIRHLAVLMAELGVVGLEDDLAELRELRALAELQTTELRARYRELIDG